MESIGDFALNIIPNLDTIKLFSGITALDSLTNIANKIFNVFKGAYGVVDDTADKLRDLAYVGKELNMPVEQIKILENTMKKFGLNSEQAANALRSISKFKGGAPFGEFDTNLILKAGLLPTDFGKDPFKNIELLAEKYAGTTNVNVREAIASLVPGMERMLTSPAVLRQYLSEARKQTDLSGIDFGEVEKYGKGKGDFAIALDNLAMAMSNAALPGLTSAIKGLTEILGDPSVKTFFSGVGKVLSVTGQKVGDVVVEGKPILQSTIIQDFRSQIIDYFSSNQIRDRGKEASQNAANYINNKFNVYVKTDGTHADVKIEQDNMRRNMNSIQNTHKSQRVGN